MIDRGRNQVMIDSSLFPQGLRFEVVPSRFAETLDKATFPTPHDYAQETARQKALEVAQRLWEVSGSCQSALAPPTLTVAVILRPSHLPVSHF